MNDTLTPSLVSVGRASQKLGLTVPRFERLAEQLGIRPSLRLDGIDRYREHDVDRIADYLRKENK